eukprot:TRINITY_DN42197_c0_g1_i1.p1 TRINITY_DN42197_c0_g1~~TRINITY_DN42197_c0_g1_i1.p1  ORF type:complete len:536 (+),score=130.65 TRINITY_DN42197_c0_g1_i1:133-1740(+)
MRSLLSRFSKSSSGAVSKQTSVETKGSNEDAPAGDERNLRLQEEEAAAAEHEGEEEEEEVEDEELVDVLPRQETEEYGDDPSIYEVALSRRSMVVKWGFHWNPDAWEAGERILERLAPNSPAAEWDRQNPGNLKVFDKLLTVNGATGDLMVKELRRKHIRCRFKADVVRLLVDHQIRHRPDPFASMSSAWLAGGLRGAVDEVEEEEADEAEEDWEFMSDERREELQEQQRKKAEKEEWEESENRRKRQLASEAMGHVTWMRARQLKSDFVPHWQTLRRGRSLPKLQELPQKTLPPPMESEDPDVWWKAPMPIVAGQKRKYWVWNQLFVDEVKLQAEGRDMALACVSVRSAQKLYRKNPALQHALQHHVVAVSSTGDRFFWSQAFVQLMDIAHQAQDLSDGVVRFTEEEIRSLIPGIEFPVPGDYPPELKPKALILPVPKSFSREKLPDRRSTCPQPPPLPERLPCTIPYHLDAPWTTVLATKEQKAEFKYQQKKGRQVDTSTFLPAHSAAFDALGGDETATESEEWHPRSGFDDY